MLASGSRKIVLYPYGHPRSDEHRELCSAFMLALGGDVQRVIDGPFVTIDRFIRYVSRIPAVTEGPRPIVVLTRTIPLAMTVLNARRKIEIALPALQRASWAIFVDAAEDPFFEAAANKVGSLDGRLAEAPIWSGPSDAKFLILSPDAASIALVRSRGEELLASSPLSERSLGRGAAQQPSIPSPSSSGTIPAMPASRAPLPSKEPSRPPFPLRSLGTPWGRSRKG